MYAFYWIFFQSFFESDTDAKAIQNMNSIEK